MRDIWVLARIILSIGIAAVAACYLIGGETDRGILYLILSYVIGIDAELDRR